jgi:hypothetical protein
VAQTINACSWYLGMGTDVIRGRSFENSLEVTLDYSMRAVSGIYANGVHGTEFRELMPIQEAIEWLNKIQREWSEYGSQIGSMIDGLRKYQV